MTVHAKPCRCWYGPAVIHSGGCCFADDPTPLPDIVTGTPPPCGHWVDT